MAGGAELDDEVDLQEDRSAIEAVPEEYRLNLGQCARFLDTTDTTLREWLARYQDFPVAYRGKNGRSYVFDARAVAEWKQRRDEELEAAEAAERERVAALQADLFKGGLEVSEDLAALTTAQRRDVYRAEFERIALDEKRGKLVQVDDVQEVLSEALVRFRTELLRLPDEIARSCDLDRDQRTAVENMVEARLRVLAETLRAMGNGSSNADDDRDAA